MLKRSGMTVLYKPRLMVGDAVIEEDSDSNEVKRSQYSKSQVPVVICHSKMTKVFKMSIQVKVAPRTRESWQ